MDWETEIWKWIKSINPQTIFVVGVIAEGLKRSIWHTLGWSKDYFWIVPFILAFPATYLLSLPEHMSRYLFMKNSVLTGCLIILIYDKIIEPAINKYRNQKDGS